MKEYPTLKTKRLFLRPFFTSDAKEVCELGGDPAVVEMLFMLNLCTSGVAREWICHQHEEFEEGNWVNFAITHGESGRLMGSVGLDIDRVNHNAEIIYWLGKEFWGLGHATEAAQAVMQYGFDTLRLHRIYARYLVHNTASGRVLEKLGMTYEGCLRGHLKKNGVYENLNIMSILRNEYEIQKNFAYEGLNAVGVMKDESIKREQ